MFKKQRHGYKNEVILEEENTLLALRQKALSSTTNSQILGRNGEIGIRDFLTRYLPSCFGVVSGHFVTAKGVLSPEIDILIVDSRFPYVSQNIDGSAIVMIDSVLATIEVKLSLGKREIQKIRSNSIKLHKLSSAHIHKSSTKHGAGFAQYSVAYKASLGFQTIADHFFKNYKKIEDPATDLYILRLTEKDQIYEKEGEIGANLWLEGSEDPSAVTTLSPLSDFYYRLIQNAYYTEAKRKIDHLELGKIMCDYMSWGTFPSKGRKGKF